MQKTSLRFAILTSVLLIIFLMQPITQVIVVEANPFTNLSLGIESPKNTVYNTTTVSVIFNVDTPIQYQKIIKLSYSLDGSANRTLSVSKSQTTQFGTPMISYVGTGILRNLSNGTHLLDVYALDAKGKIWTYPGGRTFMVNATSMAESGQPFDGSNLTIALLIATIAIMTGASLAVLAYKRRKKVSVSHD
jgi:hypothetical protein